MNLRHLTARTAVAGATAALAAGALVGIATPAANAATVTNTYTCSIPSLYSGDFALTVDGSLPVPQYWAGAAVPAGLLNITAKSTVPADAAPLLAGLGYTGAKSDDFGFALSGAKVSVPLSGNFATAGGTTTWNATGANTAFTTPAPGTASAILPSTFSLTTTGGTNPPVTLTCNLKTGETAQTLASIELLKQKSALTAKAPKTVKKGKVAKVKVTGKSTSLGSPVTGAVVAKDGKKVVGKGKLNSAGKATVKLSKKLKPGKHKIKVTFAGTSSISGSTATVRIKVVK